MSQKRLKITTFLFLLILTAVVISLLAQRQQQTVQRQSNYAIHARQDFNQPSFYPITPTTPNNFYRPTGAWVGRLILPTSQQMQDGADWVLMEVEHAPSTAQKLIGKIVRLEWKNDPDVLRKVKAVTHDVNFTPSTIKSQQNGNIHPVRLNGIPNVGVLRSLAGARPTDDVIVTLDDATVVTEDVGKVIVQITHEPILATGRFYGLVKIIKPDVSKFKTQYFRVRHYNPASGNFDGAEGIIRIPQQPSDTRNIVSSTPLLIDKSAAGENGWYIYGARDAQGVFTVQALAPRSLFQIQPDQEITNENAALKYIKTEHWQNTSAQKGIHYTVFLNSDVLKSTFSLPYQGGLVGFQDTPIQQPTNSPSAKKQEKKTSRKNSAPVSSSSLPPLPLLDGGLGGYEWQQNDKAIVLHLFGGIGGRKKEALGFPFTITGHFAFGIAQVIRDSFTNELRFDIKYHQIYAHNSDGIIAGTHTWADFMGNLQRGWMYTRPVSDILIKFDPVTQDYDFDGIKISPLIELQRQLQVMIARYRIGDGTGGANVSPATSCVQDSAQALYATITAIRNQVAATPQIQQWLDTHPNDPQTKRFSQLISLGAELEKQLAPLGIVRADWKSSTSVLAGTGTGDNQLFRDGSIWAGLTSWRTMMPRQVHDDLASIFLKYGASLQVLRTNQIGGWIGDILPLAPTVLFGQIKIPFTEIPILPILLNRVLASLKIPTQQDWLVIGATLLVYSIIAIPLGLKSGFLQLKIWSADYKDKSLLILRCLFLPAISEELLFRVLLIPHPIEITNWLIWSLWALLSLILFTAYHPLNAKTFFKQAHVTFFNRTFLFLATLLGIACTIAYLLTGSLFVIVMIHWIVVVVWLIFFGGMKKLNSLDATPVGWVEHQRNPT
ncbi:abortive infection protein [Calothrix sp. NIES-4071]|nr:abortive infection protein [Calothrix sp. NIES-4071]BAZ57720.1 abortive infection protein [Calothrix sp. NIES-4105]